MTDDNTTREELVEAIAWWRSKLPDAQQVLAESATNALVAGVGGIALAELAGIPTTENPFVVESLIDRVADELGLDPGEWSSPDEVAVRRMCRELLAGKLSERQLSGWVHYRFAHESDSEPINRLANLDDEYDEFEEVGDDPADVREQIREVATLIVDCGRRH